MRETYILGDLLQTLIQLEIKGNSLYTELAHQQEDQEVKFFFQTLADQELKHKILYNGLLEELEEEIEPDADYKRYVDALLAGTIHFISTDLSSKPHGEAFEIAVRLEKDTLLFLMEVQKVIPKSAHGIIEKVMTEERKHLEMLYRYLSKI